MPPTLSLPLQSRPRGSFGFDKKALTDALSGFRTDAEQKYFEDPDDNEEEEWDNEDDDEWDNEDGFDEKQFRNGWHPQVFEQEDEENEEEEEEEPQIVEENDGQDEAEEEDEDEKTDNPEVAAKKLAHKLDFSGYRAVDKSKHPRANVQPSIVYQFDPKESMPRYGTSVFVGYTTSGKTRTMWNMMYHMRNQYDVCMVFVGSAQSAIEFRQFMPDSFIFSGMGVDYNFITEIVIQQEVMRFEGKEPPRILLVFDDFAFDKDQFNRSKVISWIFKNGRHANIMLYISTQYYTDLCRAYRTNTKVALMQRDNKRNYMISLFQSYNTCFPNFQMFQETFLMCTENYGTIVLLNDPKKTELHELVFWFRSDPNIKFRMCPKSAMWAFHKMYYNPKCYERKNLYETMRTAFLGAKAIAAEQKAKNALPTDGFSTAVQNYVFMAPDKFDEEKHKKRVKKMRRRPVQI